MAFVPQTALQPNTVYELRLLPNASNGFAALPYRAVFKTEEVAGPVSRPFVMGTTPGLAYINVSPEVEITTFWSEPLNAATVTTGAFTLEDSGGNPVAFDVTYNPFWYTVALVPQADLNRNETYHVKVIAGTITNLRGESVEADYEWYFKTKPEDLSPPLTGPYITQTTPQHQYINVRPNVPIQVWWSEALDESTLTTENVELIHQWTGRDVPVTLSYDSNTNLLTIQPDEALQWSSGYQLKFSGEIKSAAQVPFEQSEEWELVFLTRSATYGNVGGGGSSGYDNPGPGGPGVGGGGGTGGGGTGGGGDDAPDTGEQSPDTGNPDKVNTYEMSVSWGDPSGSSSEVWAISITGKGPDDSSTKTRNSPGYGEVGTETFNFQRNNTYEVTLKHVKTDPEHLETYDHPDYDWSAQLDGSPGSQVKGSGNNQGQEGQFFVVGERWLVDNSDGLLGTVDESFDAQNFTPGKKATLMPLQIKEVSFAGSKYHELKSDDGATTYSAPHWLDQDGDSQATTNTTSGEKNYPVGFTRNTKPNVGAKFKILGFSGGQNVKVKGSSSQGLQIPETAATVGQDGMITLDLTTASNNLSNSIQFHNADSNTAFKIDWEISVGSSGWSTVGNTKHTVYITRADPIKTATSLMRETLFNLGCRNANGLGYNAQTVVDAIYNDFKDRNVQRVKPSSGSLDGAAMKYWGNPPTAGFLTTDLLSTGDGRCGAWTRMFTDVLRSQGIDAQITAFYAPNANLQTLGPAIQAKYPNYQGHVTYLFGNPPQPAPLILVKAWNIGNEFAPIDNQGIAAQGNPNPQAYFGDHFVVEYEDKYYDPSYGSNVFASQREWEDAALDAFGLMIHANPALPDQAQANPALPQGVTIWMWQPDPKGSAETIPQPFNY